MTVREICEAVKKREFSGYSCSDIDLKDRRVFVDIDIGSQHAGCLDISIPEPGKLELSICNSSCLHERRYDASTVEDAFRCIGEFLTDSHFMRSLKARDG